MNCYCKPVVSNVVPCRKPHKKFKWAKMGAGAVGRSNSECKRVFEEEEEEEEGAPPTNVTGYNVG